MYKEYNIIHYMLSVLYKTYTVCHSYYTEGILNYDMQNVMYVCGS